MTWWGVEAWRGGAALLVVWAHWAAPLGLPVGPGAFAFTGVDLFFVLSGFVFAPIVLGRSVPLLPYALRRLMRIYPAYLVALAVYALLAWQEGRPLLYLVEHLLMAHSQSREMTFYYNPAFWSLPVEVEFYVLLPLLAALLARGQRWTWPVVFALAVSLRLVLTGAAGTAAQGPIFLLLHHLPGLLVEFLLGVWVWQRLQSPPALRWRRGLAATGLLGWLALAWLFVQLPLWTGQPDWRHGQLGLAAAVCFALLLLGTLRATPPANRTLALAGWWAGRLSYGVYLLHMAWLAPALALARHWGGAAAAGLALPALLASAFLLHALVEAPARRWGRAAARRVQARRGQ